MVRTVHKGGGRAVARKIFGEDLAGAAVAVAFTALCAIASYVGTGFLLEGRMPHDLSLPGFIAVRIFIAMTGTTVILGAVMVVYMAVANWPNPQKNGTAI